MTNSIRKDFRDVKVEVESLPDGSRQVVAIISTDSVDRDGEVVLPKGLVKQQFQGNPIVLYSHDRKSLPIGSCNWIKAFPNFLKGCYRVTDKTQLGRDVFGLIQDGVLKAHSINFLPIESSPPTTKELIERPDWQGAKLIHRKWELLELSVCSIPCNPEALALAVAKCAPETRAELGKAWEPEESCVEWGVATTVEKTIEEKPAPKQLRQPTRCVSWSEARKHLNEALSNAATVDDFMRILRGKAN
jgi:phage head maturation protease